MRPSRSRLLATLAVAAGAVLVLAGCGSHASVSTKPVESYKGEPKGVEAPASSAGGAPWAVWMTKDGDEFAVVLYGSDKCPPKATGYKVTAPDEITIKVAKQADSCTDGYSPWTTVFDTPSNLDRYVHIQFTAQDTHFYLAPVKKKK
ncbi:YgdI/YgdR family lipoprotein [Gryllotalpicola ginsengisoli]|uniref:hypothetical protein n=1 Tax=Gryllotalpicola ginsengisoli TaxID=444608 RepID=UPI0003B42616|nr:hypothetical protein [Gryllotalpicola ginsengisoli]